MKKHLEWRSSFGIALVAIASVPVAKAAPPQWWVVGRPAGNPPPVSGTPNDLAVVNLGQAKWMAYEAIEAIKTVDPTLATQITNDLVGTGKPIASWTPSSATSDYSLLLLGQLKAIAAPFYARLNAAAPGWLSDERFLAGTENGTGIYPWTETTSDDSNYRLANLGQLKAAFCLHITDDANSDLIADLASAETFFGGVQSATALDKDGDGLLDSSETAASGRTPALKDHPDVHLEVIITSY